MRYEMMSIGSDFSGILVLVAAAVGLVPLVYHFVLRPRRAAAAPSGAGIETVARASEPTLIAHARSLFPVLLIVVLFRAFLFEPFRIPSASMMPGLVDGDFILVSKFSYGLRLPLLNTKILSTWEPQRGDVIVFRSTSGPQINLIKRLVGLPGDHVVVRNNRIAINGTPVSAAPDGRYGGDFGFTGADLKREKLGAREHQIMLIPGWRAVDFEAVVPQGHYFFMGDNRNDSEDSRFAAVGFVPDDHLVGHAVGIWMNWRMPGWPRLERIGRIH
jgi:signal peptidase I